MFILASRSPAQSTGKDGKPIPGAAPCTPLPTRCVRHRNRGALEPRSCILRRASAPSPGCASCLGAALSLPSVPWPHPASTSPQTLNPVLRAGRLRPWLMHAGSRRSPGHRRTPQARCLPRAPSARTATAVRAGVRDRRALERRVAPPRRAARPFACHASPCSAPRSCHPGLVQTLVGPTQRSCAKHTCCHFARVAARPCPYARRAGSCTTRARPCPAACRLAEPLQPPLQCRNSQVHWDRARIAEKAVG